MYIIIKQKKKNSFVEINNNFNFLKNCLSKNLQKRYPRKVSYGGKKCYMMTKPEYIINNNTNHIIYNIQEIDLIQQIKNYNLEKTQ